MERLRRREAALDTLGQHAQRLKGDVKQTVEIIDEGHGRAIRVFTIVTLFFLPM